jgi:TRAP-type C4-dicarboxylate transport system substrate-binding protein
MRLLKTLAAAAIAFGVSLPAQAADHTLTIASWAPPTHGFNAKMWPRLTKMIEDATDGRVTAEVKLGLAPPPAMMDLVLDGVADMTIVFNGYQAGRFVTTKLIELPGLDATSEQASVAYWRVYKKHLEAANEHRGTMVIGMTVHGPAQLQTAGPLADLAGLSGLKLRVPGGVGSMVGEALGATGIQVPAPKVYETIAANAADGAVIPAEAQQGFKLAEVAPYILKMPGGLYRGAFSILMNEEKFASLPEDIQDILTSKIFGEPISRLFGSVWDEMDEGGYAIADAAKITEASAADVALFAPIKTTVNAAVLAEVGAKGVDAAAAMKMIEDEVASMK